MASIIVYGVVDLRKLARKGKLSGNGVENLLSLPISAADIVRLVSSNRTEICSEIGHDSTELYLDAFDSFVEEDTFELAYNTETGETSLASFDVVDVGDEFTDRELVYGICVHGARKRITVAFRGCTSRKDWQVSADPFLSSRENPVGASPKRIKTHHGFYNYLFRRSQDGTNKYEAIMKQIQSLKKQYPGYMLYVTGHSLGGALATVFAFGAASDSLDDTPVTCIPIASPMVGNLSFEQAFKTLETQGRIRCLRISNHFDIFTQLPDRGSLLYAAFWLSPVYLLGSTVLFFICCQNNVYRHVGMDLHMYSSGKYKVKHARGSADNYCWRVYQDWKRHWKQTLQRIMSVPFACLCDCFCCKEDFNRNHTIQEHRIRLSALSSDLENCYLNDFYDEKRFEPVSSPII